MEYLSQNVNMISQIISPVKKLELKYAKRKNKMETKSYWDWKKKRAKRMKSLAHKERGNQRVQIERRLRVKIIKQIMKWIVQKVLKMIKLIYLKRKVNKEEIKESRQKKMRTIA